MGDMKDLEAMLLTRVMANLVQQLSKAADPLSQIPLCAAKYPEETGDQACQTMNRIILACREIVAATKEADAIGKEAMEKAEAAKAPREVPLTEILEALEAVAAKGKTS